MWKDVDKQIGLLVAAAKKCRDVVRKGLSNAAFVFQPFSKQQKRVLTWWCEGSPMGAHNGIIADGAIRSGKTLCMSLSFVVWGMTRFKYQNFALCGKTIGSLRRNVIFWLKLMLKSRGYTVQDRRTDNLLIVSRGEDTNYFYVFGGKDERSQDLIQGITLAGVMFDEVALMPESFVNQATARCSVEGSKWWFNCNPGSPQHWFKLSWIDRREDKELIYLHFTMDDNLSLSEKIKERYRLQYAGVFYQRYILGLWVLADGLVYPMFDEAKHVTDALPSGGRYYVSIDYGTVNPFSAGLWCVQGQTATRITEYYHNSQKGKYQKTDEEYYTEIERLARGKLIQTVVVDPSAASFIECIRRHGKFNVREANNKVLDGIRNTSTMLNLGMLKFSRSCVDSIREFGLYSWDTEKGEDAVLKEWDHAMDDIRYFVRTIMRNANRARREWGNGIV